MASFYVAAETSVCCPEPLRSDTNLSTLKTWIAAARRCLNYSMVRLFLTLRERSTLARERLWMSAMQGVANISSIYRLTLQIICIVCVIIVVLMEGRTSFYGVHSPSATHVPISRQYDVHQQVKELAHRTSPVTSVYTPERLLTGALLLTGAEEIEAKHPRPIDSLIAQASTHSQHASQL